MQYRLYVRFMVDWFLEHLDVRYTFNQFFFLYILLRIVKLKVLTFAKTANLNLYDHYKHNSDFNLIKKHIQRQSYVASKCLNYWSS